MATKNNTREGIHSGLSQGKSDDKWSDMLNFRCSDNRTFVVPHKKKMLEADAGLHTILHGVGDLNYAIGSKKSYLFRSHDDTEFLPLWKARLERVTTKNDQSENILVRGSYLGTEVKSIRLVVLDGVLVLDTNWPDEPVVETELISSPMLDCSCNGVGGGNSNLLKLIVTAVNQYPAWTWGKFNIFKAGQLVRVSNPIVGVGFETHAIALVTNTATDNTLTLLDANYLQISDTQFSSLGWHSFEFDNNPGYSTNIKLNKWLLCQNLMYACILDWDPLDDLLEAFPPDGALKNKYWTLAGVPTMTPANSGVLDFSDIPLIVRKTFKSYLINFLVSNLNKIFKAKNSHTSAINQQPDTGLTWATYWNLEDKDDHSRFAAAAKVSVYRGRKLLDTYKTNANGLLSLNLPPGKYKLRIKYPDHPLALVDFTKTAVSQTLTIQIQ